MENTIIDRCLEGIVGHTHTNYTYEMKNYVKVGLSYEDITLQHTTLLLFADNVLLILVYVTRCKMSAREMSRDKIVP